MSGLFDNIKNTVESVAGEVVDTATEAVDDITGAAETAVEDLSGAAPDEALAGGHGLPGLSGLPEMTLPGQSPSTFEVLQVPSPMAPTSIPVPYPNLQGIELPELPDPGPVTISAPHVGEGSTVTVIGAPDVLMGDLTSIEVPDLQIGGDGGGLFVDVDPIMPGTPTLHGGAVIGGVKIDAELDGPGIEMSTDGEIVATVDPQVTGLVPHIGGVAAGGHTSIDLQPDDVPTINTPKTDAPSFDAPTFKAPTFDAPTFETPTFETPTFGTPSIDLPSLDDRAQHAGLLDMTHPGQSPSTFEALRVPSPLAPSGIPVPYPNLGSDHPVLPDPVRVPDLPDLPDPVTISAPRVGEGSVVPVVGAPDVLLGDPESIELPDLQLGNDDAGLFIDIDPIVPGTPTAHGGAGIGGVEVDATFDGPGVELHTDGEIVATVDPQVTGLVPHIGGVAAGGDTTIDLQPDDAPILDAPSFDAPAFDTSAFDDSAQDPTPDDFQSTIEAIDDTAEQFDIFD